MMRPSITTPLATGWRRACMPLLFLICSLLAGCGGGGLFAGVGSGGSGVAEGTLSGFGSVIVDGIEYSELALLDTDRSALRLGQRVRLTFGSDNAAQSISVLAQLRGPVTQASDDTGWLRIAGQWVRLVQSNTDASRSGITLLDGFGGTQIDTGQDAVAYGSWSWDDSKAAYVLVATRIEKLAEPADPVLLGGVAVQVGSAGFRLGSASGTQVVAARLPSLAEASVVSLQVDRGGLLADAGGAVASVTAQDVQDASLGAQDLSGYQTVRVGGLATAYDGAAGTVVIQGTQLRVAPNGTPLATGQFVRAQADGSGGSFGAATVQPRNRSPIGMAGDDGTGAVTELKGQLSGVNWTASSVTFVLRGVTVQADAAQIASSCRAASSTQTLYVVVSGYSPSPTAPLRANAVNCTSDLSAADDV